MMTLNSSLHVHPQVLELQIGLGTNDILSWQSRMSDQNIETYCATTDPTISSHYSANSYSIKSFVYNCWQTINLESICDMLLNRKKSLDITIWTLIPIKTHFLGSNTGPWVLRASIKARNCFWSGSYVRSKCTYVYVERNWDSSNYTFTQWKCHYFLLCKW